MITSDPVIAKNSILTKLTSSVTSGAFDTALKSTGTIQYHVMSCHAIPYYTNYAFLNYDFFNPHIYSTLSLFRYFLVSRIICRYVFFNLIAFLLLSCVSIFFSFLFPFSRTYLCHFSYFFNSNISYCTIIVKNQNPRLLQPTFYIPNKIM